MRAYTGDAVEAVSRHEGEIWELSRKIWEHPETALEETYAAEQLCTYLERQQNAIRSYASLDVEQLRNYALPVMEATGTFAAFLEGRWSLS